jgi:hypothetical protein
MRPILLHIRRRIRNILDRTMGPSLVECSSVGTNPLESSASGTLGYIDTISLGAERTGAVETDRELLWPPTRNNRERTEI